MQAVSYQMVQMLQTVSQDRENKKITIRDFKNAIMGAYLTVFPGITMHPTRHGYHPLGYYPECFLYYVKGEADGKASMVWRCQFYYHSLTHIPNTNRGDHLGSTVRYRTNVVPSVIHPNLKIKAGEVKMILDMTLMYTSSHRFSDGRRCSSVSIREAFGFLFLTPRHDASLSANNKTFFSSVSIFSPNPGLFDETPPR